MRSAGQKPTSGRASAPFVFLGGIMKKLISAAISVVLMLTLSGCTSSVPEGYQQIRAAKEKYESLDSGRATMTDLTTGESIMEFSFLINKNNEMIFNYYGKDSSDEMYAYSNGAEYYYKEPGARMWSVIGPEDENYIYNLYSREYRYPYADGGIFFLDGGSVESAEVLSGEDGTVTIKYVYDTDKLNSSVHGVLTDVDSFSSLTTVFSINSEGYITEFTETGTVTDTDGVSRDINMCIAIDMMNDVYEIPYPVDQLKKS